jgi:hypothetical protein
LGRTRQHRRERRCGEETPGDEAMTLFILHLITIISICVSLAFTFMAFRYLKMSLKILDDFLAWEAERKKKEAGR